MVEITYQMVLSTLQTAGILVGILYYIISLNYTRKNQEQTLKTRNAMFFHQTFGQLLTNNEAIKHLQVLDSNKFSSLEEFWELFKNPELRTAYYYCTLFYENFGTYIKEGVLDIGMIAQNNPWWHLRFWEMYKDVIYYHRKEFGPSYYRNLEYLMNALQEYLEQHPELAP